MNIFVLGWYGTETIGDRAIFAGLLSFFNQTFNNFKIHLGSLNPFFTERTLDEDYSFYKSYLRNEIDIILFNSTKPSELDRHINKSDLIVMGGGPLMHIDELYMVEYAFKKAKLLNKKTAILGCGIGPLFTQEHQTSVLQIVQSSDIIVLRDHQSKNLLINLCNKFKMDFNTNNVNVSLDPAFEATSLLNNSRISNSDYIALNLRKFPDEYSIKNNKKNINRNLEFFVNNLSEQYTNKEIKLIPMHYFHIGNDDRLFLNEIALKLNRENLFVQNKNLSLEETMIVYKNAYFSIGMRFHSVLIQTLLNGKNYILDYTEPQTGKINAFIKDIDSNGFYNKRQVNLQTSTVTSEFIHDINSKFNYSKEILYNSKSIYIKAIKELK